MARRDGGTTATRLVLWSQCAFFGFLLACIAVAPGYLFRRNEGGISNYGIHPITGALYTLAFGTSAALLLAAARVTPTSLPTAGRLRTVLVTLGALLLVVLASTYPYKHGDVPHDLHVAVAALTTAFEAAVAVWLATRVGDGAAYGTLAAQLLGVVLATATVLGALDVLFASQLLSSAAFAVLLVRGTRVILWQRDVAT